MIANSVGFRQWKGPPDEGGGERLLVAVEAQPRLSGLDEDEDDDAGDKEEFNNETDSWTYGADRGALGRQSSRKDQHVAENRVENELLHLRRPFEERQ